MLPSITRGNIRFLQNEHASACSHLVLSDYTLSVTYCVKHFWKIPPVTMSELTINVKGESGIGELIRISSPD